MEYSIKHAKNNILISVIVPVFNTRDYIRRCIESILYQNYRNLEVILVDDGSTDGSGEICEEYAKKDERVIVVHRKNGGQVIARNAGLRMACGEYVAYVDSDDWIEKEAFQKMAEIAGQYHPDFLECHFIKEYHGVTSVRKTNVAEGIKRSDDIYGHIRDAMKTKPPFVNVINGSFWNKLIRRSFLERFQYDVYDTIKMHEDTAVTLRMLLEAETVYYHNQAYYHYCVRDSSTMYGNSASQWESYMELCRFFSNKISNGDKLNKRFIVYHLFDMLFDYLPSAPAKWFEQMESFPFFCGVNRGDHVILYGKGLYAQNIKRVSEQYGFLNIVDMIDSTDFESKEEDILNAVDKPILIAIGDHEIAEEIRDVLTGRGVGSNRIKTIDAEFIKEENLPDEIKELLFTM